MAEEATAAVTTAPSAAKAAVDALLTPGNVVETLWDGAWYTAVVKEFKGSSIELWYPMTQEIETMDRNDIADGGLRRSKEMKELIGDALLPPLFCDELNCGEIVRLVKGRLPNMAKSKLPEEEVLRTWTWASQVAFWVQRREYWSDKKLSILQTACRKRSMWAGGDMGAVRDRLVTYEFKRRNLLEHDHGSFWDDSKRAKEAMLRLGVEDDDRRRSSSRPVNKPLSTPSHDSSQFARACRRPGALKHGW